MTWSRPLLVLALGSVVGLGAAACATPAQAESCERYVACIRALDEQDQRETNVDRFDPGGACWNSDEQARVCDQSCGRGLEWIAERYAAIPQECEP